MSILKDLRSGVGLLLRGLVLVLRRRRLALLGMVPPLFVSAVMVTLIALLGLLGLGPLTEAVTGWVPESLRMTARVLLGIVIMAVAIVVAVVVFASLTLAVGAPIYERISLEVERDLRQSQEHVPEPSISGIVRSGRQSGTVVLLSALAAILVFLIGLIPVVGTFLSLVTGALIGGYFLAVEMISGPFDRWGVRDLVAKFGTANSNRAKVLGFGVPTFLLFSVPMLAVVLFPAATAGATLLAHELQDDGAGR